MSAVRRVLIKLGIVKRKPYTCRHCGYVVPLMGSRQWQAVVAYDHFEKRHWEPDAQTPTAAHQPPAQPVTPTPGTPTSAEPETAAESEGESDE